MPIDGTQKFIKVDAKQATHVCPAHVEEALQIVMGDRKILRRPSDMLEVELIG